MPEPHLYGADGRPIWPAERAQNGGLVTERLRGGVLDKKSSESQVLDKIGQSRQDLIPVVYWNCTM